MPELAGELAEVVSFKASQVAALVGSLSLAGIVEFDLQEPNRSLKIRLRPTPIEAAPLSLSVSTGQTQSRSGNEQLRSPAVGRFHLEHPFAGGPGRRQLGPVHAGDIIGFLRIGEVLLPIKPERDLTLVSYVVTEGAVVGYGDALCNIS